MPQKNIDTEEILPPYYVADLLTFEKLDIFFFARCKWGFSS